MGKTWKQRAKFAEREVKILREMMQHAGDKILRVETTYRVGNPNFTCVVTLTGANEFAEETAGALVGEAINRFMALRESVDAADAPTGDEATGDGGPG